jgi:hypothetical protein
VFKKALIRDLKLTWVSLREERWLAHRFIIYYALAFLLVDLAVFVIVWARTYGLLHGYSGASSTDFLSFYTAGQLADHGPPALAYDHAAHNHAEQALRPGVRYNFFFYPPIYLMVCALLARLPYVAAFVLFQTTSFLAYLFVAKKTLHDSDWKTLLPIIAFPVVFWSIGLGQNSLLTAALFGGALLLLDRQPLWAGVLFGLVAYKPDLGVLIPIALAAGRRWQAFMAATLTVVGLVALSLVCFGPETWHSFFTSFITSQQTYETGGVDRKGFVTLFGAILVFQGGSTLATAVQAIAMLGLAIWVFIVWRRDTSLPMRAATLLTATPLAVPVAQFYELVMSGLAMMWCIRATKDIGWGPWEKTAMAILFVAAGWTGKLGFGPRLLFPLLVALGAFAISVLFVRREWALHDGPRNPARFGRDFQNMPEAV